MRLPARLSAAIPRWFLCGSLAAGAITAGTAKPANAFCGFYVSGADAKLFNNATQVVLMREGTRTVLSMANNYEGPSSNFAMVVPVPVVLQKENVRTLPRTLFAKVDQLDAPRLVEYWEQDPCAPEPVYDRMVTGARRPSAAAKGGGAAHEDLGVKIEAQFTVGEYEIVILSAKDAAGLDTWLKQEKYKIPEGSEPYFRPYVQQGSKFFVARVDVSKVQKDDKGHEMLSPLRFHYDSEQFSLPVRLGLVNSKGTQDLIVHVLAKGQRYEVANYPNAFIPTNLDVSENARGEFGPFYAALYDKTLEKNPKAVVTEYSWDAATCDPCPGPALDGNDLATLGADVLPGTPPPESSKGGRRGGWFPSGFTITRLHARYTKESLGEDLVFRAAPAVLGGREVRSFVDGGTEGELEHGATPTAGYNNFQGRYAIRHPWGGPVACKEPHRGRWGGPPAGIAQTGDSKPKPAKDLAFVPRDVPLGSFLRSEIPELGAKAEGAKVSAVLPPSVDAGSPSPMTSSAPEPSASAPPTAGAQPAKSGCGCEVGPRETGSLGPLAALLYCVAWAARRRRTAKIEQTHGNLTSSPQTDAPADS